MSKCCVRVGVFCFKQKTAYAMRISDWSSDVCSSDLVTDGGVIRSEAEWVPAFGLDFTLRMDGFAWMFTVLVTAIGLLVVLYSRYYMSPADPVTRFLDRKSVV